MTHRIRTVIFCAAAMWAAACTGQGAGHETPQKPARQPKVQAVGAVLHTAGEGALAGTLRVERKGETKTAVLANAPLFPEDRLVSGSKDTAAIRLNGGAGISMNGSTALVLRTEKRLTLEKGEIWVDTPADAAVETPKGTVAVEGGKGVVRIEGDGVTVSWVSGRAHLEAAGAAVDLSGGDEARIDAEGARKTVIKDPASLTAWTEKVRQAVAAGMREKSAEVPPPLAGLGTLTARLPGGKKPLPFRIVAEDVQVRIRGNMAVTRVEQVFENPTNRVVEAEYRFPIPQSAVLTGYDMEVNGRMMRGEMVERERGRKIMKRVIDDYLYMMRDPALTEWESGSTFKTRIFPIQPKEQKRIVLTHLMPLSGAEGAYRYVLPVSMGTTDSPSISKFRVHAEVSFDGGEAPEVETPLYATRIELSSGAVRATFDADDFVPRADFVLTVRSGDEKEASVMTYGEGPTPGPLPVRDPSPADGYAVRRPFKAAGADRTFLLRLTPDLEHSASAGPAAADWLFLVDTSESRFGPDMEIQKRLLGALVDVLGSEDRVKVIGFDTFPVTMSEAWTAPSSELKAQIDGFLSTVEPGGATNLEGALLAASSSADAGRPLKVVMLGDGAATLGETAPSRLAEAAAGMFLYPSTVSAVGIGSSIDRLLLETLTRRTGGRYFSLSNGEDLFQAAVRIAVGLRAPILTSPMLSIRGVDVQDVVPETLPSLSAGEELLVAGRYRGAGKLVATLSGTLGQKAWQKEWTFDVGDKTAENTYVPLVWAAKKIDALTAAGGEAAVKEIVSLSKKYGVASRFTSFIVLENNAMYREFNVDRTTDRLQWDGAAMDEDEAESSLIPESAFDGAKDEEADDSGALGASAPSAPSALARDKKVAAPARRSAASKKAKGAKLSMGDPWDFGGGYGPSDYETYNYYPPRPVVRYALTVRSLPSSPSQKVIEKAQALDAAVRNAPLDRRARQSLVRYLIQNSLLDAGEKALSEWTAMDRSNPEVHLAAGDLYRLEGKLNKALRAYSSVLDLQKERARVLEFLAAFFESQSRWADVSPFITSLSDIKPKDTALKVRRAVTELKAGRVDEAVRITAELTEPGPDGIVRIRRGVRLSKADKNTVLSIAINRSLPLLYEAGAASSQRSAGLKMTLAWDGPAKLVLWASGARDRFLGGAFGKARLTADPSATRQTLFVKGSGEGRYRVQVLCASSEGCGNVIGQLLVESHGKKRTVPFTLSGGAVDAAVVRVEKHTLHY